MARHGRFALVVLVSLAIASTGLCTSLSVGVPFCPVDPAAAAAAKIAPDHGSCRGEDPENPMCPASNENPTCRTCDDTFAFLLKGKTDGAGRSLASVSRVPAFVPRPAGAVRRQSTSLHLSQISASPPLHLLNVTFRN